MINGKVSEPRPNSHLLTTTTHHIRAFDQKAYVPETPSLLTTVTPVLSIELGKQKV